MKKFFWKNFAINVIFLTTKMPYTYYATNSVNYI